MQRSSPLTSEVDIEGQCRSSISNSDVFSAAEALGPNFAGTIKSYVTVPSARTARKVAFPSASYGICFRPESAIVTDIRPYSGWDLHIVDSRGLFQNTYETLQPSCSIPSQAQGLVIAMFGGSTMMGQGSRLPSFTIPALTERLLSEVLQRPVSCLNFGVGGTASADAHRRLIDEGGSHNPDVVLFYDGWNDCSYYSLLDIMSKYSKDDLVRNIATKSQGMRQIEMELSVLKMFEPGSALKRAWRAGMNASFAHLGQALPGSLRAITNRATGHYFPIGVHTALDALMPEDVSQEQWQESGDAAGLRYLKIDALAREYCANRDIKFVHALQPTLMWGSKIMTLQERGWVESGFSTGPVANSFAAFKDRVFDKQDGLIIDLTDEFSSVSEEVYIDTGHLNRIGNLLIAKTLAETVLKRLKE